MAWDDRSWNLESDNIVLFKAASVPIIRHVKILGDANPYDPVWEIYFEKHLGVKMAAHLAGRWQLRPDCHRNVHSQGLSVVKPPQDIGVREA